MSRSIITDPAPLQSNYVPTTFRHRDAESDQLETVLSDRDSPSPRSLFLHGPRGTGKTHLVLTALDACTDSTITCYVPCQQYDTQYKALKRIYKAVTDDDPADGHHTANLQRTIEDRTQAVEPVIVLDDLEFILHNDGDDLLYFLSRLDSNITLLLISATIDDLADHFEQRTHSSLQAEELAFAQYSDEERYDILAQRARAALATQSLHRQALTYIASSTQNLSLGLHWLRIAAQTADDVVTEHVTVETQEQAYRTYVGETLDSFTDHHELLHQAIEELWMEDADQLLTGDIYKQYQDLCRAYGTEVLSHRRVSDFLTHLEYLDLVDADHHYGGQKGKTREIRPPGDWWGGGES